MPRIKIIKRRLTKRFTPSDITPKAVTSSNTTPRITKIIKRNHRAGSIISDAPMPIRTKHIEQFEKISVVMPLYNHEQHVLNAIKCTLLQSYTNFELIIVNDASTDSSGDIALRMAATDKRIRYVKLDKNQGTGNALNIGFGLATGKYGTWVSSDNYYCITMLERFYWFFQENPKCKFVFSGFRLWENRFIKSYFLLENAQTGILSDFIKRSRKGCISGMCFMFYMDLKREIGDFELFPGEDYVMGVKMGLKTNVGYIDQCLGDYIYHDNSISARIRNKEYQYLGEAQTKVSAILLDYNQSKTETIVLEPASINNADISGQSHQAEISMEKQIGWLVNDCLTCITGTKTLWHYLLQKIPGLQDKTFGYTPYEELASKIEHEAKQKGNPQFIIRNASYFRRINLNVPTISLVQDIKDGKMRDQQLDVCNSSNVTVFNSAYTAAKYQNVTSRKIIIPLGVDFSIFTPQTDKASLARKVGILPDSVLFVGSTNNIKGWDILLSIMNSSNFNFCCVMKDTTIPNISNTRIRFFNRVDHTRLVDIYNACSMLVCTSLMETQHLAGIEAAACNIPIVASNVGCYHELQNGTWGRLVRNLDPNAFLMEIDYVFNHYKEFSPRQYFLDKKYDTESCVSAWINLVNEVIK